MNDVNDAISRQQAIETFKDCAVNGVGIDGIVDALKQLPSAEPKRETTTLKIGRTRNSVTMWYECAECGEPVDPEDAFCRRCGRGIIHE